MTSILRTLKESDPARLPILAQVWRVEIEDGDDISRQIESISRAMLDPARAEMVWDALSDTERAALQMLISIKGKMPEAKFERIFGAIRRMGAAAIEREQPQINPETTAEGLYYRGLIGQAFENADTGPRTIIYIPDDLVQILPAHKTSYDKIEDEAEVAYPTEESAALDAIEDVDNIRQADTSLVDDLTTLLAFLQLESPLLQSDSLSGADGDTLAPHLLTKGRERLAFMLGLALSADLIEIQGGRALPKRAEARRWLSGNRGDQVRLLAEAWRDSTVYVDLWHVPGLHPDLQAGTMTQYNPAAARGAVFEIMEHALPAQAWWSLDDFILLVHEDSADFQRPNSDFDSWYIRNDDGEYLTGIESWDAVEGALLEFIIAAPMHWLGLMDLADDAARLTAYGRAFLGLSAWPNPPDQPDKIDLHEDGVIFVSRKVPRIDRFQIARFATWGSVAVNNYTYRLDPPGIERAAQQGINVGHIGAFITRALGDQALPPAVARLLESWKTGPTAQVSVERLLVLRTTAPETLDFILETPAIRRFMGARLGPMAAIVRSEDLRDLRDALGEHGIQAEIGGGYEMIKNIRAKNFKSWQDTGDIRVAPITGFFGTNSSGKTSLLQMLLLLKQTAQSSDPKQVLFFGDDNSLVNLGTFYYAVHRHEIGHAMEFSLVWGVEVAHLVGQVPSESISFTTSIIERADHLMVNFFTYKFDDSFITLRMDDVENQEYEILGNFMYYVDFERFSTPSVKNKLTPLKFYGALGWGIEWFSDDRRSAHIDTSLYLERMLSDISYLGPLREYPKRNYLWGGDTPSDVGRRGERTMAALLSERAEKSRSYTEQKVAYWLQKMGLIHSFSLRPIAPGRRDYEVVVKKTPSSAEVLITDIGFGVSQLLPVLVLCYYVPEGLTIIFEQPEIHLHPSVQADLADVFIEVKKERNVQIIFESHSEYLLHRLQRRIAEERLSKEDAALYFCSMGEEASQIEELRLDEYGNIANWPKDFFGDTTGDLVAMTEAAMKRKLAEQS